MMASVICAIVNIIHGAITGLAVYIAMTVAGKRETPWKVVALYWTMVAAYWFMRAFEAR